MISERRFVNVVLYEKLKQAARSRSVITYGDIALLVGVDISTSSGRREIGRLIAEICAHEVQYGRPMLGSLVVRGDTGMPGAGYFKGASRLGQFNGRSNEEKRLFWAEELEKVYKYWASAPVQESHRS